MRIVVYEDVSGAASSLHARRVGGWVGDDIVDLQRATPTLPAHLLGLIAGGESALERAREAIERATREKRPDVVMARDRVRLHAPAVHRPRIACAAGNYAEHRLGSAKRKGGLASAALSGLG